jgi:hypothetical protein
MNRKQQLEGLQDPDYSEDDSPRKKLGKIG